MEAYKGILLDSNQNNKSKDSNWIITIVLIVLALITWILTILAPDNPQLVERLYSSTIYPYIGKSIGFISNIVPFSIAEVILIMLVLLAIILVVLILLKPRFFLSNIKYILHLLVRMLAILYILFYFSWGFNYYREDYIDLANMNKAPGTIEDLENLSIEIINNLNNTRINLTEDNLGVFIIEDSFQELSRQTQKGFENYMVGTLNLDENYGKAKPVLLSKLMSYTGIMGIYFPYTSEANINADIPYHELLATIGHEMAHQRGFAKEEEANFIAYKASINNPDIKFQYSGYYLAMRYLMNEIYEVDKDVYNSLYSRLSDAVKRDMNFGRDYWKSKEGKTEEVVSNMNDNYLKANNQIQGVRSYNLVVKLLLAEYKDKK